MIDTSASLQTSAPRQALHDLYTRGEHYALLKSVLREFVGQSVEAELVLWAIRAYSALGLTGPACELLDELEKSLGASGEIDSLRQQFAKSPSGQVAWDSCRPRFERNAALLYEKYPQLRERDVEFRSVPELLDLFCTRDGNLHLSTHCTGLGRCWVSGLYDKKRLIAQTKLPHDPNQLFCAPYLVAGDRLGDLFELVFSGTQDFLLTFRPRTYFVEPEPLMFGALMYVADIGEQLCDERASVLVGPSFLDDLSDLLRRHPARAVPEHVITMSLAESAQQQLMQLLKSLDLAQKRDTVTTIHDNRQHYDSLDAGYWRDRFDRDDRPLRLLGLTSRFTTVLQHSMRDLKSAFERLGHRFELVMEENDHDLLTGRRIAGDIESLRPDLVFQIDHLRREHGDAIPANVPSVCWIQDRMAHLFAKDAGRQVGPLEFVIGYGFPECLTQFHYPADRFLPCLIPTDPEKMLDPDERAEDLEPFRCDVMYASNYARSPEELFDEERRRFGHAGRPLVDTAYDLLMEIVRQPWFCGDYDYESLVRQAETASGTSVSNPAVRSEIAMLLRNIADLHLRLKMVRAAARWADETGGRFHLYGLGWDKRDEFSRFARGVAKHGVALGRAFRGAKISLHGGCNPALHQRVLDGLCAKGFFLIGAKPSDASHAANRAILRFINDCGVNVPDRLRPTDLPEPHASFYADFLRVRGTDPAEGVELTREMILNVRAECEDGTRHTMSSLWPEYDQIVFASDDDLIERIEHFTRHDDERKQFASKMREAVLENFTYDALARSVIEFIRDYFCKKANQQTHRTAPAVSLA